jgi:hypothetical protein
MEQLKLHAPHIDKRRPWTNALWLLVFLLASSQISCNSTPKKTEAQKIVDSFTEKVNADLLSHKSTKDVWSENESQNRQAGWYMERVELPASASINVEKTESLVSPYLGTAEFPFVLGSVVCALTSFLTSERQPTRLFICFGVVALFGRFSDQII